MTTSVSTSGPIRVYCLPVSGSCFAAQIGMISAISAGFKRLNRAPPVPNIALASSGGNITAYIAHAAKWSHERIFDVCRKISSDTFVADWTYFFPNWVFLPFTKAMHRTGYGLGSAIRRMFSGPIGVVSGTEIWTGVYSNDQMQHKLFTNKPAGQTILTPQNIKAKNANAEIYLSANAPPVYMAGNQSLVADVILASASIPWAVGPVCIDNELYSDGGMSVSSPLSILANQVSRLGKRGPGNPLRLFYFASSSIDTPDTKGRFEVIHVVTSLVSGSSGNDMRYFVDIAHDIGAGEFYHPEHFPRMSHITLGELIASLDDAGENYAILLYPEEHVDYVIELQDVKEKDFAKIFSQLENGGIGAFVWR